MSQASLEALFERYRSAGDLEALGAVFDRTAPELQVLAAHLVRDPVEAEDLVQACFVAAIEGARSFDPARRLQPWLAGILAHQAARARRERARPLDHIRLARVPVDDPGEQSERRELRATLMRGLEALAPPDRQVLERYAAGERPLDIARAAGRSSGSVRMQILRALERLRRVLQAGLGGVGGYGASHLGRPPRGLDALRAEVLARGELASGAGPSLATSLAPLTGGLLMSTKLTLAGLAAAVLAFLVLSRSTRDPGRPLASAEGPVLDALPATRIVSEPPPPLLEPVRVPVAAEDTVAPGAEAVPVASVVTPFPRTGVFLVGDLLGLDALDPELVTISIRTRSGEELAASGTREARYRADITGLLDGREGPPTLLYVAARHPAGRKTELEFLLPARVREASHYDLTEARLDLELLPRTAIAGRVQPCAGVEAESVRVALVAAEVEARSPSEPLGEDQCDAMGAFLLYPESGGDYVLVARAAPLPPVTARVRVAEGERAEVAVLVLEPGGLSIEGLVRVPFEDRGPWSIRAARVIDPDESEVEAWRGVELRALGAVEGEARTDPSGAFRITGLTPGSYTLELSGGAGVRLVLPYPALRVNAPASGVVIGESYGLVGVRVAVLGSAARDVQLRLALEGGYISCGIARGETVQVVADRRMRFLASAHASGLRSTARELPALSRALVEELELVLVPDTELATLRITWTVPAGLAAPDWASARWRRGDEQGEDSVRADADGCRFEGLLAGRYRVTLEPCAADCWELRAVQLSAPTFEVQLDPGRTSLVNVDWLPAGGVHFVPEQPSGDARDTVHAEVRDASGRALDVVFTHRNVSDGVFHGSTYSGSIPLRLPTELRPKPAPGLHELVLSDDEQELARVLFVVLAGEDVTVAFTVP